LKEETERTTTDATKVASKLAEETAVVVKKLEDLGGISKPAARRFLDHCREESPGSPIEDIAAVIDQVVRTINTRKIFNPVGLLVTEVPGRIAGYVAGREQRDREKATDLERATILRTERDAQSERERAKAESRRQHLSDHPENCEKCRGHGRYGDGDRYICNCPVGQRLFEEKGKTTNASSA
jgi:hypothetical protein